MRVRHILLGKMAIALMALPLAAQTTTPTPVISAIQAPYPAVQSQVTMPPGSASSPFPRGTVSYGPVGTPLVLSGKNFGAGGSVLFPIYKASGTVPGIVTSWSESIIFVTVPLNAGAGGVTVVTDQGKTSNPFPFIVTNGTYSASCAQFPPASQFQITTSSLPNGTANQSYSVTLAASGGKSPYTWSLTGSQGLPAGLSLNASTGVISGTPTSGAGPLNLNVEANDSSSPTMASDAVLGLTVDSPTLTPAGVYSYSASYDSVGNITSYTDSVNGKWSFTPDNLNRLASATPVTGVYSGQSQQLCFAYDSFGNRTQADLQTAACSSSNPATANYNAANHVTWTTLNSAVNGFTYDAAGNVTYDGNNYYAYDGEGRLCAMQTTLYSGGTVAYGYIYDAEGRRVAKGTINVTLTPLAQSVCNPSTNGFQRTESYVLGQGGEQLTTLNGSGAWQRTNVYGAGQLIATYDTTTSGLPDDAGNSGGLHFQLADPLGTRRVQTNSAGEAELDCQSLPFGDQQNCFPDPNAPDNDQDEDATGSLTGIHFTGKERDAESGLDYFGARYMSSSMGRFMSPDYSMNSVILELPQSWNKYSYELNRPTYGTDPDGRCPWCVGAIVGGVVEGGFDLGKQLYNNGGSLSKVSWGEVGANAVGGAVAGALAVATGGASLVESAVVGDIAAGGTANVVGGVVTRALDPNTKSDDVLSAGEISQDAVAGFVGGGVGHLAGDVVHVPDEPVHNGRGGRGAIKRDDAKFAKYNNALANQITRATVTGSAATHTTNGGFSLFNWFFNQPPKEPCFSTSASDNHGNSTGSSGCQ